MLHPSTKKLVDKLLEMTAASKIDWKEGDEASCFYDTEGYRVTIGQSPSRLVLLDAGGRVLETASEILLNATRDEAGMTYAAKVEQMVAEARRQLTGSVAAIDHIVSALDLDGNGIPDIEEDVPEAASGATAYPDETEMTSRVAALAQKVNSVPPEVDAEPETDAPEAASEPNDAETVELASETEAEIETEISEDKPDNDYPDDERDTSHGMTSGQAVTSGAAAVSGLAAHSGMGEPEISESSEGWTLPEAEFEDEFDAVDEPVELEEDSTDIEASFTPVEASEAVADLPEEVAEAEPETVAMSEEKPAEPEPSEPVKTSGFGAIGAYGTDTSHVAPTHEAEAELVIDENMDAPEVSPFEEAEAVVQPATHWGQAQEGIDAPDVTPLDLTTPKNDEAEDQPAGSTTESTGFISQFAASEPELSTEAVGEAAFADEAEYLETEYLSEEAATDETIAAEPVDVRLAGTPYVTGYGRVLPAQVQEEAELQVEEVMPGLMSEITDLAEEFTDVTPAKAADISSETSSDLAVGSPDTAAEAEEPTLETAENALADAENLNDEMLSVFIEETETVTPSEADEPKRETSEPVRENSETAEVDSAEFQETTIQEIAEAAGSDLPEVDRMTYEPDTEAALPEEQPEASFETDVEPVAIQSDDVSGDTPESSEKAEGDEPNSGFLSSVTSGIGAIASQAKDMAESAVGSVTGNETDATKPTDTVNQDDDPQVGKKTVFKYNPWM